MKDAREVLRQLAVSDRDVAVLTLQAARRCELDPMTRALVQLSALVADDAPTASLRWAADVAAATGADDVTLVRVLAAAGSATGSAQMVKSAPRLALALDVDIEVAGWDGS